jgi:hypothetical protein
MDGCADLIAEHAVHELVLFDAAAPGEGGRYNRRAEVIASAGVVLDLGAGARDRVLDALLYLLSGGHDP